MRACRLPWLLSFLAVAITASGSSAWAAESHEPKFVSLPIYYLTDRAMKKDTFSGERRYPINCRHDMYYGTATIVERNFSDKKPGPTFDHLGWETRELKGPKISEKQRVDSSDPVKAKTEFFDRLAAALDRSGDNQLCIFIHGAEEGFEDALEDAADLAYSIEHPLVLYSWPSESKLIGYSVDNGNCEWSEAHFNMFLNDLERFKQQHQVRITLISHSMGNRIVIRAIPRLKRLALVDDFEMVSPDMDLETCKHYLRGFAKEHPMVRLYTSTRDKMLVLSQMMFGGYYRLGEGPIGSIGDGGGRSQSEDSAAAAKPDQEEQKKTASIKDKNFERIDFTVVDKGFEGHTIPFELIANMMRSNEPGPGLALIEAQPRISGLAKFESWSHHLDEDSAAPEEGYELLVVKTKTGKEKVGRKEASNTAPWKNQH